MVYLIQHGEAKDAAEDPDRDLREEGIRHSREAAAFLRSQGLRPQLVWHSGKLRAEHTARIIAEGVGSVERLAAHAGLLPGDDPSAVLHELEELPDTEVVIVGHLPFLDRLVALMIAHAPSVSGLQFRNAGIVALARREGRWTVQWLVPPGLLHKES